MKRKKAEATLLLGFARDKDIQALFELLGMLSRADGAVAPGQITEVERFIAGQVPESRRDFAITCFRKGKEIQLVKNTVTERAFVLYGYQDEQGTERWLEPLQVLDCLFRVAFADGDYSDSEDYLLDSARATLGVHKRSYWTLRDTLSERLGIKVSRDGKSFAESPDATSQNAKRKASHQKPLRQKMPSRVEALTAFELGEDATIQQIKSTYRTLVKQFHPDQLSKKISEAELKDAVKRFCEIQEAYEVLTSSKAEQSEA